MNILMIGMSNSLCKEMINYEEQHKIFIIEEPEVLKEKSSEKVGNVKKIYKGLYHQSDGFMKIVKEISINNKFDVVIPAVEYAVKASNKAAEYLDLPKLGNIGAEIFTDKVKFRDFCNKHEVPQPMFLRIKTLKDLQQFFVGKPIIFKPSNRQGSLGVNKIQGIQQISEAYRKTTSVNNGIESEDRSSYIAEEYVDGKEYSVEMLVQAGKVKFVNFTKKDKFNNGFFVESGHSIPACLNQVTQEKINKYMNKIIKYAKVESSILHAEWIINGNNVWIIECAARRPGDQIPELLSLAYNFSFMETYLNILQGIETKVNWHPSSFSAIRYFKAKEGKLECIDGINTLNDPNSGVINWKFNKEPGEYISEISSSWERVGYYIIAAKSKEELETKVEKIESNVVFNVK